MTSSHVIRLCLQFFAVAGLWLLSGCIDFEEMERQDAARLAKLDEQLPIGTDKRLFHNVNTAMRTNRPSVQIDGDVINIRVTFDSNLTDGMIRRGIQMTVRDAVKAVYDSGFDFSTLNIEGQYPFINKLGETNTATAVRATFARATVERIVWERFLKENIYDIAEDVWLHPVVKGVK